LRDPPVKLVCRGRTPHADHHAAAGLDHFEAGVGLASEFCALADMQGIATQVMTVQKGHVHGINTALQRLQPIAFLRALRHEAMCRRYGSPFEIRRRRLVVRRSHIDPDHIAAFDTLISGEFDLLAEAAFDRFRRHFHALAGYVVFPAMIRTAQSVLFVAAEPQRHAAMRTELIHDANTSEAVAEGDQPLAKELHPHRRAVRFGNLG